MKKKLIAAILPVVAALGLWAGLGSNAAANAGAKVAPKHAAVAQVTKAANRADSENPSSPDGDNVQSGDQTTPDTGSASENSSEGTSESESTTPETDGVDCQQDGNFDGVNAAGTGPGCDGSGQ